MVTIPIYGILAAAGVTGAGSLPMLVLLAFAVVWIVAYGVFKFSSDRFTHPPLRWEL